MPSSFTKKLPLVRLPDGRVPDPFLGEDGVVELRM